MTTAPGARTEAGDRPSTLSRSLCQQLKPVLETLAPNEVLDVEHSGPLDASVVQTHNDAWKAFNIPIHASKELRCQTMSTDTPGGMLASAIISELDRPIPDSVIPAVARFHGMDSGQSIPGLGDWSFQTQGADHQRVLFGRGQYLVLLLGAGSSSDDTMARGAKQTARLLG